MSEEKYVLIIEDDSFYSNVYKTKIEKEGLSAVLASDGEEALKIAMEKKPALVILDLVMPGKDGFQTLTEMSSDPNLKDIPVVVLSNLSQEEDIKYVMDLGAKEYIIKANIPINELIQKIKKYLI
ncbi:MAG: response regulator [Candidatus Moranbacteria bacterium]|jgi:DNA-binding response OmpR family regulator|nr:response regulator [Candidatus Moranbacteria bacterium]